MQEPINWTPEQIVEKARDIQGATLRDVIIRIEELKARFAKYNNIKPVGDRAALHEFKHLKKMIEYNVAVKIAMKGEH
jgi:hypothetical protein